MLSRLTARWSEAGLLYRAVAILLALTALTQTIWLTSLPRTLIDSVHTSRLSDEEAQRQRNGPLAAFAVQVRKILPADSCVQVVHPEVGPARASNRHYIFITSGVLVHNLYPRSIRPVADAEEALARPACGSQRAYVLLWIEPEFAAIAAQLTHELDTLVASPWATLVAEYRDAAGNTCYLFELPE